MERQYTRLDEARNIIDPLIKGIRDEEAKRGAYVHLYGVGLMASLIALKRGYPRNIAELAEIAGSILSQTGKRVNRCRLTAALIRALSALPQPDWLDEYRAACVNLGQPVRLLAPGREPREGVAVDLGSQAELLVRFSDGTVEAVNAGEVTLRPAASTT